jgi:hypothetical protein
MANKNKDNHGTDQEEEDQEGGSGGEAGGAAGSAGGGTWFPNYYELMGLSADEKELSALAEQALFEQRLGIKSKGYDVTALSKIQKLRNQMQDPSLGNSPGGGGLGLEEHPELVELGGDVDPNLIVLPESEAAERASSDPKLQLQLRNRLAAKLGMSADISLQSMKAEYEQKMKMRLEAKPEDKPRYRPSNAPKPRPM